MSCPGNEYSIYYFSYFINQFCFCYQFLVTQIFLGFFGVKIEPSVPKDLLVFSKPNLEVLRVAKA